MEFDFGDDCQSSTLESVTGGTQDLLAPLAEILVELEFHAAGSSGTVT